MSNILLVPVHLDALVLAEDKMVVEPVADFSRLPYCDGTQDVNPDVANISEEIISTPFQNQNLPLKAGIHLHWSLPDALTRARHNPDSPDKQDFPPVPNRWLITRCKNKVVEKEWLVESDYLYPTGDKEPSATSVTIPYHGGQSQPFRYLGRSMELNASRPGEHDEYYPKLTAVGYGEPTFAAFYPNCHSVFGFFDPDYSAKPDGRWYCLIGWYSDPAQDLPGLFISAHVNKANNNESTIKALEDEFKWTLGEEAILMLYSKEQQERIRSHFETLKQKRDRQGWPSGSTLIESIEKELDLTPEPDKTLSTRTLYYAKLTFNPEADFTGDTLDGVSNPAITVGNTGTEALSSYLAATIKNGDAKNIIEDQLEALQLSDGLEHRQLDIGPKFLEARHEKGFTAVPGGSLWTIRPESTTTGAADASDAEAGGITLPDDMAHLLNAANDRQQEYDRAWEEIESLRKQLFSDWYKYMLCAYPPEDARDDYPNIDEVKSYIEVNVASLNKRIIEAGTLVKDEAGKFKAAKDGPTLGSLAARLAEAVNALQASVELHNETTRLQQRLKELGFNRDGKLVDEAALPIKLSVCPKSWSVRRVAPRYQELILTIWAKLEKAKAAVIEFQKSRGVTPDGTIGPDTRAALRQFVAGDKLKDANPSYRLKQVSGPRYWEPTEPVVLIKGSVVEASERHGHDGRPGDGLLETDILADANINNLRDRDFRWKIRERIDELEGRCAGSFAFSTWTQQPWNPFLLEWEVEVFPVENKSNLDPATGRYHTDFASDNYQLVENEVDLSFHSGQGSTTKAACVYSGRSILTPHAGIQLTKQIKAFLTKASWLFDAGDIVDAAALCTELKNGTGAVSTYFRARFARSTTDLLNAYTPGEQPTGRLVRAVVDELNLGIKDSGFGKSDAAQDSSGATDDLTVAGFMRANRFSLEDAYPLALAQTSPDTRQAYDHIREARELLIAEDFHCLSQSLGGFNEALLMHKQTMQLRISDPLGFDDYQSFAASVSDAVSNSIYSAPEPLNDFNPIRSGAMKILQLRLVDTFGQIKDLNIKEVLTSEPMTNADPQYPVRLAPRLVQPARINFRWLAAEGDEQEMNDHPATTPICGWMLTNNLDSSLMICDGAGKALGSLDQNANWEPAPGSNLQVGDPVLSIKLVACPKFWGVQRRAPQYQAMILALWAKLDDPDKISNVHLSRMVKRLRDCGAGFLKQFISAVDRAFENIEPENFSQHQDLALLMGRPVALVRASLNLELQGLPAYHQGWNEFRQDMQRSTRDDNSLSEVRFPIRIGQFKQFNDGLVGYWKENTEADSKDWFFAPQSDDEEEITDERIITHRAAARALIPINQTVNSEPQFLSMLIDPRGLVHATSGILPAKAIAIPPDQYAAALQAIEITFLSTPIITDAGKLHLPLPTEAGYQWSWLQDEGGSWSEVSARGVVQRGVIDKFGPSAWDELKTKKWIEEIDSTRASVRAKDMRSPEPLSGGLTDKAPEIEDLLDRSHIGPVNPVAKFSGPQEIREGWLKLSVDTSDAN